MTRAVVALGANLGDREATLLAAARDLAAAEGVELVAVSPLLDTVAVRVEGEDPDAPRYLNGVALAETTLSPHALLDLLQAVEARHGRVRGARWGDRTLDIDLILYGGRVVKDERLTVPHPRAHERDFVLSPWLALDPSAVLMGHGRVEDLLRRIGDTTRPLGGAESSGAPPSTGRAEGGEPA
ncbi:MAG: 2-amino-4-hydroxy-6-hydroxymethyldihydropteridine diphosphokinase [Leucobacter sp.]|nr:2-amino-4-hydroxy-6-hydroxymethyldihydropteridine diphosphokinase [Leucobacter sp.]